MTSRQSDEPRSQAQGATALLETAAVLLDLAMQESQAPVDELGGALERIALALASYSRRVERQRSGDSSAETLAEIERWRELLQREVAVCIENLQFHDRMMQQLNDARECLAVLRRGPPSQDCNDLAGAWAKRQASEGTIELF